MQDKASSSGLDQFSMGPLKPMEAGALEDQPWGHDVPIKSYRKLPTEEKM